MAVVEAQSLDFLARRYLAATAELTVAREQLDAVGELVRRARLVSPSASMSVYVVDLERALGLTDLPSPHKLGSSE